MLTTAQPFRTHEPKGIVFPPPKRIPVNRLAKQEDEQRLLTTPVAASTTMALAIVWTTMRQFQAFPRASPSSLPQSHFQLSLRGCCVYTKA